MLSAAGRALLARTNLAAPASTAPLPAASTASAAAASLLCRWLASAPTTEAPASAASAASTPAEEQKQQQPESPPPSTSDQQQEAASTSAAAATASAGIGGAAATTTTQVGARLVQPVPGGGGFGDRNDRGSNTSGSSSRPPGRSLTGTVHVASTPNNTLLTLLSREGLVKTLVTGGSVGFRNSAKGTPQAAERAAGELARRALAMGIGSVAVRFRGTGRNKQFALSALAANGLNVTSLEDVTAVAYNGCRLPRRRRV